MLLPRDELDLALEALGPECGSQPGVEDLESNGAVVAEVARQIYCCHAAATQLPLNDVAVTQGFFQLGIAVGHMEL